MSEKTNTPEIRFAGFTNPWEQRKLDEFVSFFSGLTYSPADIRPAGTLVLRSSNVKDGEVVDADNVYVDPTVVNSENVRDGDIIVVVRNGSRALIGKHAEIKGFKPNTVIGAFMTGIRSEHPSFLNALLNTPRFDKEVEMNMGATINQITGYMFSKMEFMVPSSDEQDIIGDYFKKLDNLITLHQRKYDRLKNVKKSMLEKMFPRDGSNVPEIRFAGFTNPWEQRKLAEVFTSYSDPVDIPHDGYERLGIRSHAKGTFHSYVPAGHELQTAQMHRVAADKFIVNITFGWEHAVAVTDEKDAGKLVSHRFPQFSLSEDLDPKFLKFIILDENFRHHLWLASPGGAGRNRVLNINEMLQYEIQIPTVAEQKQIADVLINLDNLITLHQRKYEKLQQIKKSMLEKMFV
ncbi:restriction endonuclease subunit S [Candidatus Saccharibacteria bacterium]|nr:restriction endonuclease subunit S [Candidatus Saccharibacteria bacterium]